MRKVVFLLVISISAFYSILTIWFAYSFGNKMLENLNFTRISKDIERITTHINKENIKEAKEELLSLDKRINFLIVSQEEILRNSMNMVIKTSGATFLFFVSLSIVLSFLVTRQLKVLVDFLSSFKLPINTEINIPKTIFKDINSISISFQNLILRLVEYEKRVTELERFEGWKDISKVIVHEVGNMLTPIYTEVKNSIQNHKELNFETLVRIDKMLNNINDFLSKIREISSLPKPILTKQNIIDILEELRLFFTFDLETSSKNILVMVDRVLIMNAFANILKNSFEAIKDNGKVKVNVKTEEEIVIITFWDNGGGIPTEVIEKIFDFGISYKKGGKGIGLAITKKIILDNKGTVNVKTNLSEGTTEIIVKLPILADS
ncbi:MAG: ATP-binding protein [Brevinematales bacterium]|nr:ATP-binding protein [Brevinematales bacterium]